MRELPNSVNDSHRKLLTNIVSLFSIQGLNYLAPLITLPYLVRVLGPTNFGLLAFSQAFIQYFITFTDYGFNLSATREIALHQSDRQRVSEIFSSVIAAKCVLFLLSLLIFAVALVLSTTLGAHWPLYVTSFIAVLGNLILPVWLFQGFEKMRLIALASGIAKVLCSAAIFIFVRNESDILWAAGIQASAFVFSGLIGLAFAFFFLPVRFVIPNRKQLQYQMSEGWHVFISTAAISLYTTTNTFLLGLIAGTEAVGFFSGAEKIVRAASGLIAPVTQAIFPHINSLATKSHVDALTFIRKSLAWIAWPCLVGSCALFVLAPQIIFHLLGRQYMSSVTPLRLMAFLPFLIAASNIFGIQTMLTFGMKKQFARILVGSGILNVFLIVCFAAPYGASGAAFSVLVTEIVVTALMGLELRRRGFAIWRFREQGV
jgi:PST family polysaccharide transporter